MEILVWMMFYQTPEVWECTGCFQKLNTHATRNGQTIVMDETGQQGRGETEGEKEGREEAAVVKTTGKDSRSGEREKEGGREGGKKRRGQMKQE